MIIQESDTKQSRFLRQADVGDGLIVTIKDCDKQNVAQAGREEDFRPVVLFEEDVKPLVLNNTNFKSIAKITGAATSEGWIGKEIILYSDESIEFGGDRVGGIRVKPVESEVKKAPAPAKKAPVKASSKPAAKPAPVVEEADEEGEEFLADANIE
jgi:hypothetical protein